MPYFLSKIKKDVSNFFVCCSLIGALRVNAGQKYCRMLQREHSAILSTFIKLPFDIKIFVLSILSGRFTQVLL